MWAELADYIEKRIEWATLEPPTRYRQLDSGQFSAKGYQPILQAITLIYVGYY